MAINEQRNIELQINSAKNNTQKKHIVFPLKIYISTQSGRQYLLCYHLKFKKPVFFRVDTIASLLLGDINPDATTYIGYYEKFKENLWGVSYGAEYSLDTIEMTVRAEDGEGYIVNRLFREKRCGEVLQVGEHSYMYRALVYDAAEMLPWLRTFTGRIESLHCSNKAVEQTFFEDLEQMDALYGGDGNAV